MKLLMYYVEKCRESKSFSMKSSVIAATILAGIGLIFNIVSKTEITTAIMQALVLWIIWYLVWMLFIRQVIKTSEKIKVRNIEKLEEEKEKSKAEKRRKAEERAKNKKRK